MKRSKPRRDGFVVTIDREKILDEIVRPKANEVGFAHDLVDHQDCRRNLDHRADTRRTDRETFARKRLGFFRDKLSNRVNLFEARDHRHDYVDLSFMRRTKYRSELRAEVRSVAQ